MPLISTSVLVRKHTLYNVNYFKFIEVYVMAQNMVGLGEVLSELEKGAYLPSCTVLCKCNSGRAGAQC